MNQNSLAASMCTPTHQEILQYHNQYTYQQQQQQRMMMYGASTPVASPEHTHHQISLEQFQQQQQQQQQYEKLRRASIQHNYQFDGNRSQDENRDATHSRRHTSVTWNNTKSPSSTYAFNSDNSTHPSANSNNQNSPYMSPPNMQLNHTKNKHELSTAESSAMQQGGMAGPMPPNAIPILAQNHRRSCHQFQEQYSVGQAYPSPFFQQHQRPRLTTTLWEDEGTLCFQVDAKGICVARRQDNNMVNGTKLLNVVGMSRGKRDGILKNEKGRVVVKVGAMHLKGVWITIGRAKLLSAQFQISDLLYPLFVDEPNNYIFSPAHHSISSLSSPSINHLLQGGPSMTDQRQLSPLHASGITGYTLDPISSIRQPPMPSCPVSAFPGNRSFSIGAKSNGRHPSEMDMYLSQGQFPAMGIDVRGLGNSPGFPHPHGGYSGSLITTPHFPNHPFNGYGPPSNPSPMSRYMTSGGDIYPATGSSYTGLSNVPENSNMQHEQQMHCRQLQNQHQLQQNRRILQAMSSDPNGIQTDSADISPSKSGSTSPKPVPFDANVNSLTFQTPSNVLYRPNNVYQMVSNISEIGSGSGSLSSQTPETRKRTHDNGPGASTDTSSMPGNKFPTPLSASPPATPIPLTSGDISQPDSCSQNSAKRIKAEHSVQTLVNSNELQVSREQPNAAENAGEKQLGQSSKASHPNGHCISWTNGQKNNVRSSHGQGDNESLNNEQNQPVQSIPDHLQLYKSPQTTNNQLEIQPSPHDFDGEVSLGDSTITTQKQNQPQIPNPNPYQQQKEHSTDHLDSKTGPLPSVFEGNSSVLRSNSSRLLDRHSAVGTLLRIADKMDADASRASDQCKPLPSPTTEIQW